MHIARNLSVALLATYSLLHAASGLVAPAPVTILIDFEKPHSSVSVDAMRRELNSLLQPVGLTIDLQIRSEMAAAQEFADLLIFKMKGSCIMESTLPMAALSDERGPLAMAYSSDGEVLRFGEVECDRIRQSLGHVVGRTSLDSRETLLGRAIGLVIGHELYHMIANSPKHTKGGVTKESLTARELLDGNLMFSRLARKALEEALVSGRPIAATPGNGFF